MGWFTGVAAYIIIWWLVLFMVLPWGVKPIGSTDIAKGHASSAPRRPRMLLKVAVTTLIAAVLWAVVYVIIDLRLISIRS